MVALRRRNPTISATTTQAEAPITELPLPNPGALAETVAEQGGKAAVSASNSDAASPSDHDALRHRLAELQQAEERQREQQASAALRKRLDELRGAEERHREQQALIAAQMKIDSPQQKREAPQ